MTPKEKAQNLFEIKYYMDEDERSWMIALQNAWLMRQVEVDELNNQLNEYLSKYEHCSIAYKDLLDKYSRLNDLLTSKKNELAELKARL